MRQSEVDQLMKKYGHERGTGHVLMRIVEEINDLRGMVNETVDAISQMASVITMLNSVADGMKDKIDGMGHRDDDPRSTHAVASGDDNE
jgi:hypothetical protein